MRSRTTDWTDRDGNEITGVLYVICGGAFFVHMTWEKQVWIERHGEPEMPEMNEFQPMSAKPAQDWMMEGQVEVFSNPFEDPPEAAAETEPGSTIYTRVPTVLKRRVDEAARAANVSANVWVMRCLERCLDANKGKPKDGGARRAANAKAKVGK
jgi:predicted HicB family RNase H-like nuclease